MIIVQIGFRDIQLLLLGNCWRLERDASFEIIRVKSVTIQKIFQWFPFGEFLVQVSLAETSVNVRSLLWGRYSEWNLIGNDQIRSEFFRPQMAEIGPIFLSRFWSETVLITPPYIPAGMTGIRWNANKFHRNSYIPAGIQPESTGIGMNYLI